jgi:hypothetical protein
MRAPKVQAKSRKTAGNCERGPDVVRARIATGRGRCHFFRQERKTCALWRTLGHAWVIEAASEDGSQVRQDESTR